MTTIVEISCLEVWQEISEMIDSTLPADLQARLELHIKHCAHCRAVLDGTRNIIALIGDEQVIPLPSGFHKRLFQRLSEELCRG